MTSHGTLLRDGANYRPAAVGARNAAAGDEAGVQGVGKPPTTTKPAAVATGCNPIDALSL